MAYNFKSIADVEVVETPTETANVLIEENGLIKKSPKTAVGGGVDMVVDYTMDFASATGSVPIVTRNIVSGTYEQLKAKILAGEPNSVVVVLHRIESESYRIDGIINMTTNFLITDSEGGNNGLIIVEFYLNQQYYSFAISPDGILG